MREVKLKRKASVYLLQLFCQTSSLLCLQTRKIVSDRQLFQDVGKDRKQKMKIWHIQPPLHA